MGMIRTWKYPLTLHPAVTTLVSTLFAIYIVPPLSSRIRGLRPRRDMTHANFLGILKFVIALLTSR
jgi:hypothetical protein